MKKGNILNLIFSSVFSVGSFILIGIFCKVDVSKTTLEIILLYLAGFVLAFIFNTVMHEIGHLIFGKVAKFNLISLNILNLKWYKQGGRIRFEFVLIGSEFGYTEMVAKTTDNVRKRYINFSIGGIVFSFICLILSVIPFIFINNISGEMFLVLSMLLPASLYFIFDNVIPCEYEGVKNDGGLIKTLAKNDDECKVIVNLLSIQSLMYQGYSPAEIDEKYYFDLPQIREDNINFLFLLDYRYAYYLEKGDFENAVKVNARILTLEDYFPAIFINKAKADCIYDCALYTKDFDKADDLMYELDKYLNKNNTPTNLRIKLAYLLFVCKEDKDIDEFALRIEKLSNKEEIKGYGKHERILLENQLLKKE